MNFIFISPNFPVRYYKFVEALKNHGICVLGIGDSPYFDLHERLKNSLSEYYYVKDLGDYNQMLKACKYYEEKYGKISFIESDNEWWLNMDARLREALHVTTSFYPNEMNKIKAKSAMKECFQKGGAKTMRFVLVDGPNDLAKVKEFAKEVNYPLFAKPNIGVGANDSFPINNEKELENFLSKPLKETYIVEEYIKGIIISFDGICDSKSDVVFATSNHFTVDNADIVINDLDECYFNNPFSLPFKDVNGATFEKVGRDVVKAFGIKQRFFHIEFFVLSEDKIGLAKKGEFVGLECNMRPAGGYTPDLIDFANSVSCYDIYADIIAYDENRQDMNKEKYYAFACSRKDIFNYLYTKEEIKARFADNFCMGGRYPAHIARAMGDEYYYAKFKNFDDGIAFDNFVRAKKN